MLFLPSFYLAPVSYYARMVQYDAYCIDVDEPYRKQTLRNRCWIASPNGPLSLTIPVVKFVPYHTPMRDIRISDHGNWRHLHWNALQSSYRRTPFFEFYADDFAPFYERKWDFLVDYNQALQDMVCGLLEIDTCPQSLPAKEESSNSDKIEAFIISPPSKGGGGASYYQLFSDRHGFMPDLSIADLLFNMGPESILYLKSLNYTWKQQP
ncbi:MAG: WbqC family protein [Bacteroidaceae bacterium]|nr:WbqC family protein [Bacteroidaceae bacterium]